MSWLIDHWIGIAGFLLGLYNLIKDLWIRKQNLKVSEVLISSTWPYALYIEVVVENRSARSIAITGAEVSGIRLYRHEHALMTTDQKNKRSVFTSKFPRMIDAYGADIILMEFMDVNKKPIDQATPQRLRLITNNKPVNYSFVIRRDRRPLQDLVRYAQ